MRLAIHVGVFRKSFLMAKVLFTSYLIDILLEDINFIKPYIYSYGMHL